MTENKRLIVSYSYEEDEDSILLEFNEGADLEVENGAEFIEAYVSGDFEDVTVNREDGYVVIDDLVIDYESFTSVMQTLYEDLQ